VQVKGDENKATTSGAGSFAARAVAGRRAALERLATEGQQGQSRAVVYLRTARNHPDEPTAVAYQREGCRRIAERHGLTIVREYVDAGRPAHLDQQIELLRLLGDLHEERDVAAVIVWDYARLGRSMAQLDQVIHHIHACGAEIVTITGVEAAQRFVREHGLSEEKPAEEGGQE
jgi:hypothetical protein